MTCDISDLWQIVYDSATVLLNCLGPSSIIRIGQVRQIAMGSQLHILKNKHDLHKNIPSPNLIFPIAMCAAHTCENWTPNMAFSSFYLGNHCSDHGEIFKTLFRHIITKLLISNYWFWHKMLTKCNLFAFQIWSVRDVRVQKEVSCRDFINLQLASRLKWQDWSVEVSSIWWH